ncbi:MAG: surface lipoprotein assembly modifier [Proteobacteria bacterium]|nr:surface lipoprotein assembly modifier [Pseudomonadota bacterium]
MKKYFITFASCFFILFLAGFAFSETLFDQGLKDFKDENYEEALANLIEARKLEPTSTTAAFYLGLTYKILENYKEAVPHLRDAVTFSPPVREALVELIDSLYQTENLDEANKWIAVGEKEGIAPARIQFLKGLNLLKENKNADAIVAFEKAKEMDKTVAQAADFQIASAYMKIGKLKDSQKRFKSLITLDPTSDLATYARDYDRAVTDKIEAERPFRFNVSLGYKYDSNVNARPASGTVFDNPNNSSMVSGQEDTALNANIRAIYIAPFSFKTPYSLSVQYTLSADRYMRRDDYNLAQQSVTVTPGYSFSKVALTVPLLFGYINLQREKGNDFLNKLDWWSDTRYLLTMGLTPTARYMINDKNILELTYGFMRNKYYNTTEITVAPDPNEDRDGESNSGSLGWTYFFKEGTGIFTIKYTYTAMGTDGHNWSYDEDRFSLSFLYPLKKNLKFQYSSDAAFTKYKHDNTIFNIARRDDTFTNSIGLIYTLFKNMDIIGQFTYTKDNSNISTYDYDKSIASISVEYRF